MARRRSRREPGRPTLLDDDIERKLIEATKRGTPMRAAAAYCGISLRAFEDWMRRGRIEQDAREDGEEPDPVEQKYLDLYEKVLEARAYATVQSAALIRKSAIGGQVVEETTRRFRDATGQVVEEKTVKRTAGDWRAAAWWLERQERGEFGKESKVTQEVTGSVDVNVKVDELAARVAANLERAKRHAELTAAPADPATVDPATVVHGEVVD